MCASIESRTWPLSRSRIRTGSGWLSEPLDEATRRPSGLIASPPNPVPVSVPGLKQSSGGAVPDSDSPVGACREDPPAVGAVGHADRPCPT